jgi:two-component system, NarL family, invasion response regulator UvrY
MTIAEEHIFIKNKIEKGLTLLRRIMAGEDDENLFGFTMPLAVKRIGIIDHNTKYTSALLTLFKGFSDFQVLFSVNTKAELAEQLLLQPLPDIILIGLEEAEGYNGLEMTAYFKSNHPAVKIILMAASDDSELLGKAMHQSPEGFISKEADLRKLVMAIYEVGEGRDYYSGAILKMMAEEAPALRPPVKPVVLNDNDIVLIRLLCTELNHEQIADHLGIRVQKVDLYIEQLLQKTNCRSRIGIVLYAIRNGIYKIENNTDQ